MKITNFQVSSEDIALFQDAIPVIRTPFWMIQNI